MFRLKVFWLALFVGMISTASDASMRIRCFCCQNHLDTAGPTCNKSKFAAYTRDAIMPGIWDNFDATTGFDNVADTDLGGLDNAPYVSATYWVDSVFESSATDLRKNGPLVEGFASITDLRDPSWKLDLDNYVIYAAGHLKFDQAGTYSIKMNFNDLMMAWVDKNGDGEISLTSMDDALNGTYEEAISTWSYENGKVTYEKEFPIEISAPGIRKFMFWFYELMDYGYAMLYWKTPGSSKFVPIPSTAFGKRRQFGLPISHITKIQVEGVDVAQSSWSYLEISGCKKLTFTASADNMLGEAPTFIWDFGDGKIKETEAATINNIFSEDRSKFAYCTSVRVKRGAVVSDSSREVVRIAVEQGTGGCSTAILPGQNIVKRNSVTIHRNSISVSRSPSDVISFSVYNVAGGRALIHKSADGSLDLSRAKLPAGMYMVDVNRNTSKEASLPVIIIAQ